MQIVNTVLSRTIFSVTKKSDLYNSLLVTASCDILFCMLRLKSLELTGFKSFGKKATLEFKTPITAIVGPNGSGKSNVAESFRFVLGEQSIKSMRGKKGEDLIFNGSNDTPRANRAHVKVVFNNNPRLFNVDFDEISIERAVHRDAVNEYMLNSSLVRLKDVSELLAYAHIGSSGHHIISQGEADRILNANIRERKAMIEDALGLKVYLYKKQESEKKLLKTRENIESVESLRREIAPHIRFLQKQVEKIEKTLEMKEKLKDLYKEYLKREDVYIKYQKEQIRVGKMKPEENLARLEKELHEAKDVLSRSEQRDVKSSAIIDLEEKIKAVRQNREQLARDVGRIEGEIHSLERIIRKQQELASTEENKMVYVRDVEALSRDISSRMDAVAESGDISMLRSVFGTIKELLSSFISRNKTEGAGSGIAETEADIVTLRAQKKDVEEKIAGIVGEEKVLNEQYHALQEDIEREKDTNRDAEKAVFRIMAEQNEVISELNTYKAQEEALHVVEEDFKRELTEAGVLIGRSVLDFAEFAVLGDDGAVLSEENISIAPRGAQEDRRRVIERIKIRIEDAGGGSGDETMKEFKEATERDAFLTRELEDLGKSAAGLEQLIAELDEKIAVEFRLGIEKINTQFQHFFSLMFGGGTAALSFVQEKKRKAKSVFSEDDSDMEVSDDEEGESEVEEGIDVTVSLPHKKVKGLMMLSGGERALASIALLFAISQVNPPPFIILDETDAALDEANSRKYGDMIESLSKYSQLILITHNRETMSRAGVIYGVTMITGSSKLLSIEFDEAVAVAK